MNIQAISRYLKEMAVYMSIDQRTSLLRCARILTHGTRISKQVTAYIKASSEQIAAYAHEHHYLFAAQVLAGSLSIVSLAVVPILGAVEFSAAGPVADTVAAGWQAGVGVIEAESLFALCQSVAMGGAALGTINAIGAVGVVIATGIQIADRVSEALGGSLAGGRKVADTVSETVGDWWRARHR